MAHMPVRFPPKCLTLCNGLFGHTIPTLSLLIVSSPLPFYSPITFVWFHSLTSSSSFFFLLCDSFPSVAYLFFLSLYLSGLLPLFFLLSLLCFSLSPILIFICFFSYFWLILKMEVGREWGKRRLYTITYINGLVHFNNNYFIITFCWVVNNILVSILFFGFFFF